MKRLLRYALPILAALVVAAGVAIWLARDLPRRKVEATLAETLGAEVRLGRLTVRGMHDFLLEDLTVRRMLSQPNLRRLDIAALEVRGDIGPMMKGRFETLRFTGVEIHLGPAEWEAVESDEPIDLVIGRLDVERARIVVGGDDHGEVVFDLDVAARDIGGESEGEIDLLGKDVSLAPLLTLFGSPEDPDGRWHVTGDAKDVAVAMRFEGNGARLTLDASASRAAIALEGRSLDLPAPALRLSAVRERDDGPYRIEAAPTLPFLSSADLAGELDAETGRLTIRSATVEGLELSEWLPLVASLPKGSNVEGRADLELLSRPDGSLEYALTAELPEVRLPLRAETVATGRGRLKASGALFLEDDSPRGTLRAELQLRDLDGRIDTYRIPDAFVPSTVSVEGDFVAGEVPRIEARLSLETPEAGRFSAEGRLDFAHEWPDGDLRWRWEGVELEPLVTHAEAAGLALPEGFRLAGRLEGKGTIEGRLDSPSIRGGLALTGLAASRAGTSTTRGDPPAGSFVYRGSASSVGFRWSGPDRPLELSVVDPAGELTVPPLESVPVSLKAEGVVDTDSTAFRLLRAEANSDKLARLELEGEWTPGATEPAIARIRLRGGDLSRWQDYLQPLTGDLFPGYSVKGNPVADLTARIDAESRWRVEGRASVQGSGFSSDDFARVAEGLDTEWEITAEGGGENDAVHAEASITLGGFQLLWGSFYADYSDLVASVELSGEVKPLDSEPSQSGLSGRARLSLPEGPRLDATLRAEPDQPTAYTAHIDVTDLHTTFERYLRRPFEGTVTAVQRLQARGGLQGEMAGSWAETGWTAAGHLRLEDLHLGGLQEQVQVEGLELDLPLNLSWTQPEPEGPAEVSGRELIGFLQFDRLQFGGIDFPQTTTGLLVRADSVKIEESLAVPLLGGILGFEELILADLLQPSRHLESAILLRRLSLRELSESMGLLPLEGEIEGHFPKVELTESTLRVDGGGEFSIFGGRLAVSDISGQDLLSNYPRLTFSAKFEEIDLEQLTRTFDFGEMKGTLRGRLTDCELFRGVPVRFDGLIETVDRPGVARTINVKAINNISILGTGGTVGVFDRGIHKFFKRYTYEKLGIRMTLKDDRFLLRGQQKRGERELFLKGRLPFPIDVVNAQPGTSVSFRTMLERARKLDFSTATTD